MDSRHRLIRGVLRLILAAALLSAPIFLVAEKFDSHHVLIVLASNGVCALLCAGLLWRLRQGHAELAANTLVWGLMILVGTLASTNGEGVFVNVINFVLVTLLASVLLGRRTLIWIAILSTAVMTSIAWRSGEPPVGEELLEYRLEIMAQFVPTYWVIVMILWLQGGHGEDGGDVS